MSRREYLQDYYQNNKEYHKEYYLGRKQKVWEDNIKRKFNLSVEQYKTLEEQQNFKCAICEVDTPEPYQRWTVDHCHETGKVRGLLCTKCNPGIGFFRNDINILYKAIEYLRKYND